MSNRKKASPGFRDRTTMKRGDVEITPPANPMGTGKHYVGGPQGREITEEEALKMGRALFDSIATEQARNARQ